MQELMDVGRGKRWAYCRSRAGSAQGAAVGGPCVSGRRSSGAAVRECCTTQLNLLDTNADAFINA